MKHYIIILIIFILGNYAKALNKKTDNNQVSKSHVYYVSDKGVDTNSGERNSPFKSINTALSHATAGDQIIVRGGIYYERVTFIKSGLQGKWITLKAYPGERPVIDGSKTVITGWMALVTITDKQYITIDGFDICNLIATEVSDPEGIAINGNSHHITIKNCNIYNIKNNLPLSKWRSAHAILAVGNGSEAITDLVITGCNIYDMHTGTSENVTLAGNVDGFLFTHNKVYNTENIGIIVAGGDGLNPKGQIATNYARNGVISDNIFHDNSMTKTPEIWGPDRYGAISIYVCGGAGTIIERNIVYNSDRGIGLVSESNIYPTRTTIVRNNFVYNCYRTGIYLGDYLNYTKGGTKNCHVVNNTLYQNDRVVGAFGEIEGEIRLTENCDSNVIQNNIIYARPVDVFIHKYTSTGTDNLIDNNLYYTTGTPQWIWNSTNATPVTDFATWQAISGVDVNSAYGKDPLFIDLKTANFRIQHNSPAKNSGYLVSAAINGNTDIDRKRRFVRNKISKGANQ